MYEISDNVSKHHKRIRRIERERGFIKQTTHEEEIRELSAKKVTFYIGFDPPPIHCTSVISCRSSS